MTPTSPGKYHYRDQPGAPLEAVEVVLDGDELCARFDDEGGPALVPVADMAGTWETGR